MFGQAPTGIARPYTKWYRVWERTTPADFAQEAVILPILLILIILHSWGRRKNRRLAQSWAVAHAKPLSDEYAVVGFSGRKKPLPEEVQNLGLAQAMAEDKIIVPAEIIKEKTAQSFASYATGRQNVAFMDIRLMLYKRYNPLTLLLEWVASLLFESMREPEEKVEAVAYTFDGRERDIVPVTSVGEQEALVDSTKGLQSGYDSFIWAIVHKNAMRQLREDRYDLSLTSTKDLPQLPHWATIMTESAEITETLLTPELLKILNDVGDELFESLIVSDQPLERPTKLEEATPRKRIGLTLRFPSGSASSPSAWDSTLPLFRWFLRLPDTLAQRARFRPEVQRKVRSIRETEVEKLRRRDDEEKAEERKLEADRKKKAERDAKLKGLSAEEQRKFLDKEREKEQRKSNKKSTKRA
jgi:Protein of unknown function (DUF1682)